METPAPENNQPTTVAPSGGLSTDTIIIIVGVVAGTLFLCVIIMLCIVGCMYHRRSKRKDDEENAGRVKKSKKQQPLQYRDRIFRPVNWNDPEGPGGKHDIDEIDQILFDESRSRRGSVAIRNPAYKEDDDAIVSDNNGYPYRMGNGIAPRPPNLEMLPPERRQSSKSNASAKQPSLPPSSPTESTQISILDMQRTWGGPDLTADIEDFGNQENVSRKNSRNQENGSRRNSRMSTVSGPHNDPEIDFSVFAGGNMRGSGLQSQENTLRRSFRSRNQAIVDFYESGYSNSIGAKSAASLPMSKLDYQMDSDEKPSDSSGWGTGNRLLWQKRQFQSGLSSA